MSNTYISGYTSDAEFCPKCGGEDYTKNYHGRYSCSDCGCKFYVIVESEAEE